MSVKITRAAEAATNLTSKHGYIVRETDADEVQLTTAATQLPVGVLEYAENEVGGECTIVTQGRAHVKLGAAFTVGTTTLNFMSKNDGLAIPFVAAANNYKVGRLLLTADGASGDVVECIVDISEGE